MERMRLWLRRGGQRLPVLVRVDHDRDDYTRQLISFELHQIELDGVEVDVSDEEYKQLHADVAADICGQWVCDRDDWEWALKEYREGRHAD